jgi:hypothetical protein
MVKKEQVRWTPRGAPLLAQLRTPVRNMNSPPHGP